ncbi:hypothetical protein ES707_06734 [subsurface metagenome]
MVAEVSQEDVNRIAEAVVEKAMEDVGIRDIIIGSAMGKGAIPLYGRETRKEPCSCCLIDPEAQNIPENRMCTTKGAIGTLSDREERDWCSEVKIVSDGRCARAMAIREAARKCKEKHPDDTEAFFKCYIPAFSQTTRESNPARVHFDRADKFEMGQLVFTRGVNDLVATNTEFALFVTKSLGRHARGDWGDLSEADKRENEYALGKYLRLFSAYEKLPLPKIWIITEADRSITTILFPEEY